MKSEFVRVYGRKGAAGFAACTIRLRFPAAAHAEAVKRKRQVKVEAVEGHPVTAVSLLLKKKTRPDVSLLDAGGRGRERHQVR